VIVSLQAPVLGNSLGGILWSDIMLVGGLLVLALVPGIVAALLSAVSHAGAGSLSGIASKAATFAGFL